MSQGRAAPFCVHVLLDISMWEMLSSAFSFQSNQSTDVSAFKNLSAAWPRFLQSAFFFFFCTKLVCVRGSLCVYVYINVLGGVLALYLFPKGCSPLSPKVLSMERGMVPPGLWGLGTVGMGWTGMVCCRKKHHALLRHLLCACTSCMAQQSIRMTSLSCCRCVPGCSAAVTPKTGMRLGFGCSEDLRCAPSSRFLATAPFWYKSQGHKAKNCLLSSLLSVIYTFTSLLQIQTQCHIALEKD